MNRRSSFPLLVVLLVWLLQVSVVGAEGPEPLTNQPAQPLPGGVVIGAQSGPAVPTAVELDHFSGAPTVAEFAGILTISTVVIVGGCMIVASRRTPN